MKYPNFVGGTYTGQSPTPDSERAINLYPERQERGAENDLVYLGTPGKSAFVTLPGTSVSALYADPVSARVFAIAGGVFYELLSKGAYSAIGNVGAGPYSFASANSGQILIACAGSGSGYIYITKAGAPNTLTQITASGFLGCSQVAMIDDYFIVLVPNSREFQVSTLLDGTQWDGLDFGSSSGGADNIVAFSASHRELWLFGSRRTEIYIDDGSANFPFDRLEGAALETGCAAAQSVVRMDNTLFWLGQDERGAGIVWKANGYTPVRISNHSVEYFIAEYIKNGGISDATAYAYQDGGHTFYVLHFPSAAIGQSATGGTVSGVTQGATWVYDASTSLWHERAYLANGLFYADLARSHCYGFGKHLVGDWQSGTVYVSSTDYYDDAGAPIKRIRRAPHITDEQREIFYHELRLSLQVGVGNAADTNPQCALRISNDGGLTWGSERLRSMGAAGQYQTQVVWKLLGRARRRAYEWSTSARVPVCLIDAYLQLTEGTG